MWRKAIPVVGAAVLGLAVLTLGAFFLCVWLMTAPADRAALWPLDVAAGVIGAAWLLALWWVGSRLADYIDWCRGRRAAPAREHISRVLGREPTVEIDGLRVRPRVMRMMMPHTHWVQVLERAQQGHGSGR